MCEQGEHLAPILVEDLEDLYENAPCGYFSLCPEGIIVKVNETFCSWTGYSKGEILGRRLRDMLNMGSRIFYETHFAPLLRMQGFFNEVALDVITSTGEKLPVLANAKERRGADGELLFTRVTIFLASERRTYERELVRAKAAADALSREAKERLEAEQAQRELRDQFIAILGHDLRNPLAGISAGIGMLLREQSKDRGRNILQLMQGSVIRMNGLIENVLDFARGELGEGIKIVPDASQDIVPVLKQVIEEIRATVPARQFTTEIDIDQRIAVDHARIAQLLSNLVGNAVFHGDPDQPIRVQAKASNNVFEISVTNGGKPISPESIGQLFQAFYRAQKPSTHKGLGLGLFIAKQIAEGHGGDISVQSDEKETKFTFAMPLQPQPTS